MALISPTRHLFCGVLISCQKEGQREGVSEVGESRDKENPEEVSLGVEVQRALLTFVLVVAPKPW